MGVGDLGVGGFEECYSTHAGMRRGRWLLQAPGQQGSDCAGLGCSLGLGVSCHCVGCSPQQLHACMPHEGLCCCSTGAACEVAPAPPYPFTGTLAQTLLVEPFLLLLQVVIKDSVIPSGTVI
jgi:hypothetical protein